ncbi:MAG: spore coat associated protein CotJA [Lachnospiraceae bacterium]|nr:spore coat associated protein CotJA [Lachnospiraceae bacterium]MEE1341373.1 spore coat associated protein CotJA [Lachnospiraceae bacterium]
MEQCKKQSDSHMKKSLQLAMAYVPFQEWEQPYDICRALAIGTIFPSLNFPFCGTGGKCK